MARKEAKGETRKTTVGNMMNGFEDRGDLTELELDHPYPRPYQKFGCFICPNR